MPDETQHDEQTKAESLFGEDAEPLEAAKGICLGGWCYMILRFGVYVVFALRGIATPAEMLLSILGFVVLAVAGALFLIPIAFLGVAFTAMIAYTTFDKPLWPPVAVAAGGITGFVCTAFAFSQVDISNWQQQLRLIILGPVLATLFGQLGAAWWTAGKWPTSSNNVVEKRPWLRFGVRQILIATTWIAGVLTLMKLTNLLGPASVTIFTVWFVYQAVTLFVVMHLFGGLSKDA